MKVCGKDWVITGKEYIRCRRYPNASSMFELYQSLILQWVSIKHILGPCWKGKRLSDLRDDFASDDRYYEIVLFDDHDVGVVVLPPEDFKETYPYISNAYPFWKK